MFLCRLCPAKPRIKLLEVAGQVPQMFPSQKNWEYPPRQASQGAFSYMHVSDFSRLNPLVNFSEISVDKGDSLLGGSPQGASGEGGGGSFTCLSVCDFRKERTCPFFFLFLLAHFGTHSCYGPDLYTKMYPTQYAF